MMFALLTCTLIFSEDAYAGVHALDSKTEDTKELEIPRCLKDFGVTIESTTEALADIEERVRLAIFSTGLEASLKENSFNAFKATLKKFIADRETLKIQDWSLVDVAVDQE